MGSNNVNGMTWAQYQELETKAHNNPTDKKLQNEVVAARKLWESEASLSNDKTRQNDNKIDINEATVFAGSVSSGKESFSDDLVSGFKSLIGKFFPGVNVDGSTATEKFEAAKAQFSALEEAVNAAEGKKSRIESSISDTLEKAVGDKQTELDAIPVEYKGKRTAALDARNAAITAGNSIDKQIAQQEEGRSDEAGADNSDIDSAISALKDAKAKIEKDANDAYDTEIAKIESDEKTETEVLQDELRTAKTALENAKEELKTAEQALNDAQKAVTDKNKEIVELEQAVKDEAEAAKQKTGTNPTALAANADTRTEAERKNDAAMSVHLGANDGWLNGDKQAGIENGERSDGILDQGEELAFINKLVNDYANGGVINEAAIQAWKDANDKENGHGEDIKNMSAKDAFESMKRLFGDKYPDQFGISKDETTDDASATGAGAIQPTTKDTPVPMTDADAVAKYGLDYVMGANESSMRDDKFFGNKDGKLQTSELAESMTFFGRYGDAPEFQEKIGALRTKYEDLIKQYESKDGTISAGTKADLINTKEWAELLKENRALYAEIRALGEFSQTNVFDNAQKYHEQGVEALRRTDKFFGNDDGEVTAEEYHKNLTGLYDVLFKDDPVKLRKADDIARRQAAIMEKYAGPDGILDAEEYARGLNSPEYGRTLDEYWELRGGRPQLI